MTNGENIGIDVRAHEDRSGNQRITGSPSLRIRELGLVLPTPPTPLGVYDVLGCRKFAFTQWRVSRWNRKHAYAAGWATTFRLSKAGKRP